MINSAKKSGAGWYTKLILFLCCSGLPLWAMAEDLDSWCEHRLVNPIQQRTIFRAFQSIIEGAGAERPAARSSHATALALRKFGVEADSGNLTLTLERSQINRGNIILWLKSYGQTVFKALMHLPPLYVWKQFDDTTGPKIDFPLTQGSWRRLGIGTVLDNTFQMRKFVEIRKVRRGVLSITLGVDVDCDFVHIYGSRRKKYILFRPGYYLCRVPIIVSSGPVPQNPG